MIMMTLMMLSYIFIMLYNVYDIYHYNITIANTTTPHAAGDLRLKKKGDCQKVWSILETYLYLQDL